MYSPYFKTEILMSRKLTTVLSFKQMGPVCSLTHANFWANSIDDKVMIPENKI